MKTFKDEDIPKEDMTIAMLDSRNVTKLVTGGLEVIELFEDYSHAMVDFAAVCCIIFMAIGIPGNVMTILALWKYKKVRNATAVFIMNLSCSDLLFCCFNLPLAASTFWKRAWLHGVILCRLFPFFRYGLVAVSIFTVLNITINRYVMIGHPSLYPKLYRGRHLAAMVCGTWACGFGALVATWMEHWGRFGLDRELGSCSILPDCRGRSPKEFLFVIAFVLPCLSIVVCYARIFCIVRETAQRSRPSAPKSTLLGRGCSSANATPRKVLAEDSAVGSASTATTTTAPISSTNNAHSDKSPGENGDPLSSRVRLALCPKNTLNDHDPNLLSPPIIAYKYCSPDLIRKSRKFPVEPSSSSGIDTYDEGCPIGDRTPRSHSPTSAESSPGSTHKSRRRFASVQSLQRVASTVFRRSPAPPCPQAAPTYPGKMTTKDKKLLKMILVIFISFIVCYLPITITKVTRNLMESKALNIAGYILIYLTTCINPIIYVVMSSEYRQAYINLLMCRGGSVAGTGRPNRGTCRAVAVQFT